MANKWDDNVSDSLLIMLSNFFAENYWSNKISHMRQHEVNKARAFAATNVGNILTSLYQATRVDLPNNCIITDANMDLVKRGLGRLTTSIPRLGGHFRKQISQLPGKLNNHLAVLIQRLILHGYLVHPLIPFKLL